MVIQELKQAVTFFLLESDDVPRELGIDPDRPLTCGRMSADQRVDRRNRRAPDDTPASKRRLSLFLARVDSLEALEALAECGREAAICSSLIEE